MVRGLNVLSSPDDDADFELARLAFLPHEWRREVDARHKAMLERARTNIPGTGNVTAGIYEANRWLVEVTGKAEKVRIPFDMSDDELRQFAKKCARDALQFITAKVSNGIACARRDLARFVARYGMDAPGKEIEAAPAVRRMTCPRWWVKKLRVHQCRAVEALAIEMCKVHVKAEVYASNITVKRRHGQKRRNAAAIAGMDAVNLDTGETESMAEIVARSVANPVIRRGELMTRISGFEHFAKISGDVAKFMTLTCPSAYHRMKQGDKGLPAENPKWNGKTPREAQAYLCKVWGNIRKKLNREGVTPYGFRIAEPHHDGTPHWHLLVFINPAHETRFIEVFRHYALLEDGEEPGAQKNRMDCVDIDYKRGSAAGYVAKYISKNIDGFAVQLDFEAGRDGVTGSQRVDAWAAAWRIRQFQQFGGAPVGIWRELRRLPENPAHSEKLAAARNAADTGDWCAFTRVMGGGAVKRRHLPVRVARTRRGERWDYAKGHAYPANPTQYGDEAAAAVYGVLDGLRKVYPSRRNRYAIVQGWSAVGQKRMVFAPWSSVNNCRALAQGKNDNGMTGRDGFNNFSGENANGIGKKVGKDGCCASGYAQGMGEFAPACEGDSRGLSPAFAFGC